MNTHHSRPLDAVAALIMLALTLELGPQPGLGEARAAGDPAVHPGDRALDRRVRHRGDLGALARRVVHRCATARSPAGIAAGVLFGIEFLLIFPALQFTTASRATLFIYTAPFFVALGATFLLGEKLRAVQWLGLLCSFAGLVVAFGVPDASRRKAAHRRHHDGRRGRRLGRDHAGDQGHEPAHARRPRRCSPIRSRVSIPMLALGMLLAGERMTAMPSAWSLGWLAYQTFWVVSLTYAVWFAMVQRYSASRLSAFTFLTPLFGVASGPFRARGTHFLGLRGGGGAGGGRSGAGEPAELTVPASRERHKSLLN